MRIKFLFPVFLLGAFFTFSANGMDNQQQLLQEPKIIYSVTKDTFKNRIFAVACIHVASFGDHYAFTKVFKDLSNEDLFCEITRNKVVDGFVIPVTGDDFPGKDLCIGQLEILYQKIEDFQEAEKERQEREKILDFD